MAELDIAAVLVNRKLEVVYFAGPVIRYLDLPTGAPTQDIGPTNGTPQ